MFRRLTDVLARLRAERHRFAATRAPGRTLDLAVLEDRVLFSAVPLPFNPQVAPAPEATPTAIATPAPSTAGSAPTGFVFNSPQAGPPVAAAAAPEQPARTAPTPEAAARAASSAPAATAVQTETDQAQTANASDAQTAPRRELVFVDSSITNCRQLLDDLKTATAPARQLDIVVLDPTRDGIAQITAALDGQHDLKALHFVTHGGLGATRLGNVWLSADNLGAYAGDIAAWQSALAPDADLLFYGCNLAATADGRTLLDALQALTGGDVAGSTNDTGNARLGADWKLEYADGPIETAVAVSRQAQQDWLGRLELATFQQGDAQGYAGTQDTFIDADDPNTAQGAAVEVSTQTAPHQQGLLRFDNLFGNGQGQIPLGSTINSATLTVYVTDASVMVSQIALHRMLVSWTETDTWNSLTNGIQADGTEAIATADATLADGHVSGPQTFSGAGLTATLQAWANGAPNNGWAIFNDKNNNWVFASSETDVPAQRPLLTVDFTPPSVPGDEFRVNTTVAADQITNAQNRGSQQAVAYDAAGNYVVVWSSAGQDGSGWGVYARRFAADGNPLTGEILVNQSTSDDQQWARVASDSAGNFVVTWTSTNQDGTPSSVYARRFAGAGSPLTDEFRVNTTATGPQLNSVIGMDSATGDFVIAWQGEGPGDANGIFFRRFAADGTAKDATDQLANTADGTAEIDPAVTMDPAGRFVIAWAQSNQVYFRRFNADGTAAGGRTQIDGMLSTSSRIAIASDSAGEFTVVYRESTLVPGLFPGLVARGYNADGTTKYPEFQPDDGDSDSPSIDMAADGSFVLVYQKTGDGDQTGVYARKHNADGSAAGSAFLVNQTTTGVQSQASVDVRDLNNFVVVWSGQGTGDTSGVFARQYATGSANLPPTVTLPSSPATYLENAAPVVIDPNAVVTDPDSANFDSGTLTVAFAAGGTASDRLAILNQGAGAGQIGVSGNTVTYGGTVIGTFTGGTDDFTPLVITLNANADVTAAQALLRDITFANVSDAPATADRSVQFVLTDFDDAPSDAVTQIVQVTAVNDPPTITSSNTASVPENTTAVLTVTSADVDGGTPVYSLSGGADAAKFTIDSVTGVLSFLAAPNYEAPTDAGGDNVYDVIVQVSDGTLVDTQAIAVTVTPVNDNNPVITSNGGGANASISVAENTPAVTTVTATDADLPAQPLTYSISGGADAAKFSIDSVTGVLQFIAAPDYEMPTDVGANNVYNVTVQVSDGSLTDTQAIAVTVTPVNEFDPLITSNGGGASAAITIAENATVVTTVTATDADLPLGLSYSIVGGVDAAKFSVNNGSGVLRFLVAPNFESPTDAGGNNVYDVTVQVDDGGWRVDTQAISVTVTDLNDTAPVIAPGQAFSVAENAANGYSLDYVLATDADTVGSLQNWVIAEGNNDGIFAIEAATGELTIVDNTNLDFEADSSYTLKIQVSDGVNTSSKTNVTVTVLNINESPTITALADRTILESGTTGPLAFTVGDPETAAGSLLVTAVSSDQTILPDANLVIGGSGANHTITATPVIGQSGGPVIVTITVSDGVNQTQEQFTVTVVPRVVTVTTTADENDGDTTNIATLLASPGGSGISLREAIIATNNTNVGANPDQIILPSGNYRITLWKLPKVSDDLLITGGGTRTTTVDALGAFQLFDIDDDTVTMTGLTITGGNGHGGGALVSGGATLNLQDAAVTGNVGDEGAGVHVHGTLNLDRVTFANNMATSGGAIYFHRADGGSLTNVTLSSNSATTGGAIWTDTVISVTNSTIANNTAVFGAGIYRSGGGNVMLRNSILDNNGSNANAALNSGGFNLDSDGTALLGGAGDRVADPLLDPLADNGGPTNTHALRPGSPAIDPAGLAGAPATDQRGSARDALPDVGAYEFSASLPVGPIGDGDFAADEVVENAADGALVGIAALASDPDVGDTVSYSLDNDAGGRFAIHPVTGLVTVADGSRLDREAIASHNITVRATSSDTSYSTRVFTIHLLPVNDNAPEITSDGGGANAAIGLAENTTSVTTVAATDADLPGQTLTYSITGAADAARFAIDAGTGALTFASAPDYENPTDADANNVYLVQVTADDGAGRSTSQTISVTVTPVNDNTPVITSGNAASVAENTTTVLTVAAIDADLPGQTLTYAIAGGADAARFVIDSSTGVLRFLAAPDYEAPADSGADNVYDLSVQVSDGLLTDTQDIAVTVSNVNEAPVLSGANNLTAIDEDDVNNTGTLVSALIAGQVTDADAGAVLGIAVTAVDNTHGVWQFSTDGDMGWSAFGVPTAANARLLAADADTRVRFVPNADWNGTVTGGITSRAWDQTSGMAGGLADTTTNGGATAFSAAVASADLTVQAVNDVPLLSLLGDQTEVANSGLHVVAAFATAAPGGGADETAQTLTYHVGDDAPALFTTAPQIDGSGKLTYELAPGVHGTATVTVTVQDSGGTANGGADTSATQTFQIHVTGSAEAGGPYTIAEGAALMLNAANSTQPVAGALTYAWDLNADGIFGDATGVSPALSWNDLKALGINNHGSYTLAVQTSDGNGVVATDTTTLTVTNTAPTLTASGPATAIAGSPYVLALSATDPSLLTVNQWTINWGDGAIDVVVGNPPSVTHTYTLVGLAYNITVSARDADGAWQPSELIASGAASNALYRYAGTTGAFVQQFGAGNQVQADDVRIGPDGLLYVVDKDADSVLRYNAATGELLGTFVAPGSGGLSQANALAFGPDGNLYVTSTNTDQILRYSGTTGAFLGAFVTAGSGGLNGPTNLVFHTDGKLYVSSNANDRVLRYDAYTGAFLGQFVAPASGTLNGPLGLIFGPDGNLYVASYENHKILRYNGTTGAFLDAFVTSGSGGLDGPVVLRFGPDGDLYVTSEGTNQVLRYDGATGTFRDAFVAAGSGGLDVVNSMSFLPQQQVHVTGNLPPIVTPATFAVDENSANGTVVGTVAATEPDAGDTHTFAITRGNTDGAFAIDANSGQLTVANAAALNFETTPTFNLAVQATDVGGLTDTKSVTVNLINVNEAPTVFPASFTLPENSASGTVVGNVTATDPDTNDALTFAITGGNTGGALALDAAAGILTVADATALDFETTPQFTLLVPVQDRDGLQATATVVIDVTNVRELPSVSAPAAPTAVEDTPVVFGPGLGQAFVVSAPDAGSNGLIDVELTAPAGQLTLRTIAGLTFAPGAEPGGNTVRFTGRTADVNAALASLVYTPARDDDGPVPLAISVDDHRGPVDDPGIARATITLTAQAVNDAPVIAQGTYTYTISNDGRLSLPAPGVLADARDVDGDPLTAVLVRGPAHGTATLQPNGELSYVPRPDFSGTETITFAVSDGTTTSAASTVAITVQVAARPPSATQTPAPVAQTAAPLSEQTAASAEAPPEVPPTQTTTGPAQPLVGTSPDQERSVVAAPAGPAVLMTAEAAADPATPRTAGGQTFATAAGLDQTVSVRTALRAPRLAVRDNTDEGRGRGGYNGSAVYNARGELNFMLVASPMWRELDQVRQQIQSPPRYETVAIVTSTGLATTLSVGYVMWIMRGTMLIASLLAQMPAWRFIDPLPILDALDDAADEDDDESLESILQQEATKHTDEPEEPTDETVTNGAANA
jgi:predicted outer membrane repeat protein